MISVSVALVICSKLYKIQHPGIKLFQTELVLIPLRYKIFKSFFLFPMFFFSIKIPIVTERLRRYSEGRTLSSNLVYTIWAVFGGFILHFLLANYLSVLLKPNHEKPVETTADVVKRDLIPYYSSGGKIWIQFFADSPDPDYQEISRKLYLPKDYAEMRELHHKLASTGLYARIFSRPPRYLNPNDLYMGSETIQGRNNFPGSLLNKKWPLKKVF